MRLRRPRTRNRRRRHQIVLEQLEDRQLLTVTATVSGLSVEFSSSDSSGSVYLQTAVQPAGTTAVQWSTSGAANSWTTLSMPLASAGSSNVFQFDMSGPVYVENMTGAGGNMAFTGHPFPQILQGSALCTLTTGFTGPSDLTIQGNLLTQGGNLAISDVQGVEHAGKLQRR